MMMYSYHRLWLSMLVLAILTTTMCGFANEVEISENTPHMKHADDNPHHHLEAQAAAAATLQEMTDAASIGASGVDQSHELYDSLRFEPTHLDFGIGSVGTVRSHVVTLVNQNRNRSVYLSSVSGRTPAFYSSFFEAKMIPPNGNTTFNVVFLPREQGAVSTSLHIHTSFGKLKLLVKGAGRECPYRLKPLVGIRAPLNATLMPEIRMYNPHGKPLQILEVYSSGGQFQLELPSGDPEAPQGIWEIPPFTTKPVIRIRFQGFNAGNYSAYIRIKIADPHHNGNDDSEDSDDASSSSSSSTGFEEQILVIPVEFEILPQYGLYAVNPLLEFGYLAMDETTKPFKQKLDLRHSKSHLKQLGDLKFESLTYIKGVMMAADDMISTVSIHPEDINEPVTQLNEKLQLILKDTSAAAYTYHNIELIVRANIYKGSLHYNANSTIFLDQREPESATDELENLDTERERNLQLRNDFQIPIAIYNVTTTPQAGNTTSKLSLQHKTTFEGGLVLQPGLSWDLLVAFSLTKQQEDLKDLTRNYKTAIYVYTNVTNFEIPIVISSTRLFVSTQTQTIWRSNSSVYTKELQLNSVPLREISQNGFVILENRNSIPIKLKNWDFEKVKFLYYSIMIKGCKRAAFVNKSNDYTVDLEHDFELSDVLYAGDIAVFVLTVTPYVTELNTAYLKISTTYENITIAVKFNTVMGKLEVDQEKLHFTDCFPGKLCSSELSIRSTFKQPIHMKYINFTVPGLTFEDISPHGSTIAPQSDTTVGRMYFEPSVLCRDSCYIPRHTDASHIFPKNHMDSKLNVPPFDEVELRRRIELYRHFKYYFQNIDFVMTTKDMQHFQLNLMIELQWPQLVMGRQVLSTIEVNKSQIYEVKISNPSDQPILIDYQLADPVLAKQTLISLPLEVIILTPSCYLTDKAVFSLVSHAPKKPFLVPALSSIKVSIRFQSNTIGSFCTLLHIRNNLTLYEGIWISAKAIQSQFRLGNRKPGSQTPLLFEITQQQLALACTRNNEDSESRVMQPQIVTRRVFTARNSGELPIKIESFFIGDQPCKGYGFQVMNCSSFVLKSNSSKTIEIVFHSDFTVTRITKPLVLKTNLTYEVSYTLVAQLPSKGLDQCNALLARPPWEEKIRNATVVMLMVTFVLVLVAVHIDYGNIMYQSSLYNGARDKGQIHPTFNLRNIAMSSSSQLNSETSSSSSTLDGDASVKNKTGGLKKRNVSNRNQKQSNGEMNSFAALQNTMTLAEMVSWTFGSKTSKKPSKAPKTKEPISIESPKSTSSDVKISTQQGTTKVKLNEKSLMDKMDEDLKKSQNCKKTKVAEKPLTKLDDKSLKQEVDENDVRRDNKVTKVTSKPTAATTATATATPITTSSPAQDTSVQQQNQNKNQNKSMESCLWQPFASTTPSPTTLSSSSSTAKLLPMMEIMNQQSPLAKDYPQNGRKMGKTPGRERRKQSAQNTSPATSSCSSNSTSSSSCLAPQQSATAMTGKRNERKPKAKASNSLKFAAPHSATNSLYSPMQDESYMNGISEQSFHPDILSPWNYSAQITFNDVLQQQKQGTQQQTSSPTTMVNTSSQPPPPAPQQHNHHTTHSGYLESFENVASPPSKSSPSDLGPIGSRKSPSSSPNCWESYNSAIAMQLPRPLNTTSTTTSATSLSYNHPQNHYPPQQQQQQQQQHHYAQQQQQNHNQYAHHQSPMSSEYGFNDMTGRQHHTPQQLSPTQAQKQHDFDITAKLLEIQAHEELVRRYMEQLILHQQHQQYLNYVQAANSDWSSAAQLCSTSAWTPIMDNNVNATNLFAAALSANDPTSSSSSSSAWSMTPPISGVSAGVAPPTSGLMRSSPHILDHNFPAQYMPTSTSSLTSTANANASNFSAMVSAHSSSSPSPTPSPSYNNSSSSSHMTANGLNANNVADENNMPMFNLFGGLSSIWNDNWKQSTANQPEQQEQDQQQQQQQGQQKKPPQKED